MAEEAASWPVLQLDLEVVGESEALARAEHEGQEHARKLRLGLVPSPDSGVVARAVGWLKAGTDKHAEHQ